MPRLSDKQRAIRATGVTATDVVTLAGLSPYANASPHLVYAEKIGIPIEPHTSPRLEMGHELEPIVLRQTAQRRGLRLLDVPRTIRSVRCEHHLATPDALSWSESFVAQHPHDSLVEAKAVSLHMASDWGEDETEDIPDYVLAQVAWQIHVVQVPVAFVGALLGTELRSYRIELTPDLATLIEALREVADRFWVDHVLARRPPTLDGTAGAEKMIRAHFPRPMGPMVKASPQAEEAAERYFAVKREALISERELEVAKQCLIAACGEAEGLIGDGWRLTMKARKGYQVTPKPYIVPDGRRFDLRETKR